MKFEEHTLEQQQKAIENCRYYAVEGNDWSEFIERMEMAGFNDVTPAFSGFCSQGDGASFTADSIDLEKFLRKNGQWSQYRSLHKLIKDESINAKVERFSSRMVHENSVQASVEIDYSTDSTEKQNEWCNDLESDITSFVRAESIEYYKLLEEEYNSLTSDESVKEMIIINEIDF